MGKLIFLPVSIGGGILAGIISKKLFAGVWGLIDGQEPPQAEHRDVNLAKLAFALVLEGAVFRLVKGIVDHGSRHGYRHRPSGRRAPSTHARRSPAFRDGCSTTAWVSLYRDDGPSHSTAQGSAGVVQPDGLSQASTRSGREHGCDGRMGQRRAVRRGRAPKPCSLSLGPLNPVSKVDEVSPDIWSTFSGRCERARLRWRRSR
ncbi:MAG: DUF4235 domain-containing protein [Solirubrobacteraceae bacterium]